MTDKKPSEFHQLLITVSNHFHIGSQGQIRYQNKPLEVNLKKLEKSERNHFIHFIIRDAASGFFYAECCSHQNLIPIKDFLLRSWFEKVTSTFCGFPKALVFTKTVVDFFCYDSFSSLLTELKIESFVPPSGFASGIRVFKDWEEDIYFRAINNDDELRFLKNWNPKTTGFYSNLKSFRYKEFYRSEQRWVPSENYEDELINKFGSNVFKVTDTFPTVEPVADLCLLLRIDLPN